MNDFALNHRYLLLMGGVTGIALRMQGTNRWILLGLGS
jgi:hypothetical protein